VVNEETPNGNEINTYFLINKVFSGDGAEALRVSRRYPQMKVTLTPKSIERYLILECIDGGLDDESIVEYLSSDEHKINIWRVKRLRKELKDGKRKF